MAVTTSASFVNSCSVSRLICRSRSARLSAAADVRFWLIDEAQQEIEARGEKGPILDLVIVAGMQRIEHYEIAAYGTGIALAEAVGETDVAALLAETLEEEKQTDLKLTEVTQKAIMPEALADDEEEGGGDQGGGSRSGARRKAA